MIHFSLSLNVIAVSDGSDLFLVFKFVLSCYEFTKGIVVKNLCEIFILNISSILKYFNMDYYIFSKYLDDSVGKLYYTDAGQNVKQYITNKKQVGNKYMNMFWPRFQSFFFYLKKLVLISEILVTYYFFLP